MYHFPCPASPFPRFETVFLFLGSVLMFLGVVVCLHDLLLAGVVCLWIAGILIIVSWRGSKRLISDTAFSCLQADARFDAIRMAWEAVCGEQRRPTWKEMGQIRKKIYAQIR